MIVIEDKHALPGWPVPSHQIVGGENLRRPVRRNRPCVPAPDRITPPGCAGGDDYVVEAMLKHVAGGHPALQVRLDIWHPAQLLLSVLDDPPPCMQARQP